MPDLTGRCLLNRLELVLLIVIKGVVKANVIQCYYEGVFESTSESI